MFLSIIVCTYNRCESLKNTLDSFLVLDTSKDFNYEIIIVNNNSTDNTAKIVNEYLDKSRGRLRYLFEPIQGKGSALNSGIKEAKGEIIVCTDDDCIVERHWLLRIHQIFETKNIDLLGGKVIPFFTVEIPNWLKDYKNNLFKYPLMLFDLDEDYLEVNEKNKFFPIGANTSFRKSSFYKFGKYIKWGRAQDIELCYKWYKAGARIGYSPEVVVYHNTSPHRMTKNYFRKFFFQTGKDHSTIFKEKYHNGEKILKTPLWVYKELIQSFLVFFKKTITLDKKRFTEELRFWHNLGIFCGLNDVKIGYENLG
jgi:glycosyltransferase involved in cell wall biosynthesis